MQQLSRLESCSRIFSVCVLLFLNAQYVSAQQLWQKTFNYNGNENLNYSIITDSGFVYMAGSSRSLTNNLAIPFLSKFDTLGNILWAKVFTGLASGNFRYLIENNKGNIVLTGTYDVDSNYFGETIILEVSPIGNIVRQKSLSDSLTSSGISINQLNNGNYLFVGQANQFPGVINRQGYVMVTDSLFDPVWSYRLNSNRECVYSVSTIDTKNNLYLFGFISDPLLSNLDAIYLKMNSNGDVLWQKILDISLYDYPINVCWTPDSTLLVLNTTQAFSQSDNDLILELDTLGNIIQAKSIVSFGTNDGSEIKLKKDLSGYLVLQFNGNIYELDLNLNLRWAKNVSPNPFRFIRNIYELDSGSKLLIGYINGSADFYMAKIDSVGNAGCYQYSVSFSATNQSVQLLADTTGFNAITWNQMTGLTPINAPLSFSTICSTGVGIEENDLNNVTVSPNPFEDCISLDYGQGIRNGYLIRIELKDLFGRSLTSFTPFLDQNYFCEFSFIKSGIYFLNLEYSNEYKSVIKIIKK